MKYQVLKNIINPSCFENIILVLKSIWKRADIKHYGGMDREWLFMECDGIPYNAIRTLIDNGSYLQLWLGHSNVWLAPFRGEYSKIIYQTELKCIYKCPRSWALVIGFGVVKTSMIWITSTFNIWPLPIYIH